jgi:DNA-binding PadR family transcriptional regulator
MLAIIKTLADSEELKSAAKIAEESGQMMGTVYQYLTKLGMEGYVFRSPVGNDGYVLTATGRTWVKDALAEVESRKRKKPYGYQVPFNARGDLLHYARAQNASWARLDTSSVDWRENEPFTATITMEKSHSGRSAKYLLWRDVDDDVQLPMFVVDLVEMIKQGATIHDGKVTATWQVRKRGQNYGLSYVGPA